MAPEVIAEVYSEGKTGKKGAKDWIKEKELGDNDQAREMIPACAALDAIFLQDRVRGAINHINTEKLARKIHGLKCAFFNVTKQADWKKPGNAKSWKSKVDEESQARYDPEMKDQAFTFVNRKAEDEVRSEMEREANMLKAKNKLAANR